MGSEKVAEAWRALVAAMEEWHGSARGVPENAKVADAAEAFVTARWASRQKTKPSSGPKAQSGMTLPFGKEKGVALEEAKTGNLRWVAEKVRESLDDPDKARFYDKNMALLEAITKELATR